MRAVRCVAYGGPELLTVEEVPSPRADAGQVADNFETHGLQVIARTDSGINSIADMRGKRVSTGAPNSDTSNASTSFAPTRPSGETNGSNRLCFIRAAASERTAVIEWVGADRNDSAVHPGLLSPATSTSTRSRR